jgi:hypothetical protein
VKKKKKWNISYRIKLVTTLLQLVEMKQKKKRKTPCLLCPLPGEIKAGRSKIFQIILGNESDREGNFKTEIEKSP